LVTRPLVRLWSWRYCLPTKPAELDATFSA
jgi:hypothetical protein